jgi:hypothetical protein
VCAAQAPSAARGGVRPAKLCLKLPDGARQRWLGDITFLGGPREIKRPGDGQEVANLVHLHRSRLHATATRLPHRMNAWEHARSDLKRETGRPLVIPLMTT